MEPRYWRRFHCGCLANQPATLYTSDSPYSPSSTIGHLTDTISPIYPDRPIRPLPKRRLRSRLSPEVANSILYPTAPRSSKPLFNLPFHESLSFNTIERASLNRGGGNPLSGLDQPQGDRAGDDKNGYHFKGNDLDSDEEDGIGIIRRYQQQRPMLPSLPRTLVNGTGRTEFPKHLKATISQSTVSSVDSIDGYDSFENTNNKKKRKIPTSGSLGNHHSTLSAEMAHMGISSNRDLEDLQAEADSGVGQYYGTGNSAIPAGASGTGMSGAGRGRYGRVAARNSRNPLAVSMNAPNAQQSSRMALQRREHTPLSKFGSKGKDIRVLTTRQELIEVQTLLPCQIKVSFPQPLPMPRTSLLHYRRARRTSVYWSFKHLKKPPPRGPNSRLHANQTLLRVWRGLGIIANIAPPRHFHIL